MRTLLRLVAPVVVAGLVVGAAVTPAHAATVLSQGHVDVLDVDFDGGLAVTVRAYPDTGAPGWYDPADVIVEVTRRFTVPSSWDICATGQAWVLPQQQVSGIVWAGWNASDVQPGDVVGNQVTVTLVDVDGPQGSDGFCVYTASAGNVSHMYLDSDGSPGSFPIGAGGHSHANWTFDEPGTYQVTLEVTAVRASDQTPLSTGEHTFTFEVVG